MIEGLLPEREVHVWYIRSQVAADPDLLRTFRDILSPDEEERGARFHFEDDRRLYLLSHGFLRRVLSRYAAVPPAGWRFVCNAYGKPEIVAIPERPALRSLCFNLTHTAGLAACVVTRDREVGVDAEDVTRGGRELGEDLIRYCLSPTELVSFRRLPADEQQSAFFDYWTLKEAYLKARGFGLSLPVEGITFFWPGGASHVGAVQATFTAEIGDDPRTWQFERFNPTPTHRLSVAVRRLAGPDLNVVVREFKGERGA
jgi:4'-phosphopantetheinyl transferase